MSVEAVAADVVADYAELAVLAFTSSRASNLLAKMRESSGRREGPTRARTVTYFREVTGVLLSTRGPRKTDRGESPDRSLPL